MLGLVGTIPPLLACLTEIQMRQTVRLRAATRGSDECRLAGGCSRCARRRCLRRPPVGSGAVETKVAKFECGERVDGRWLVLVSPGRQLFGIELGGTLESLARLSDAIRRSAPDLKAQGHAFCPAARRRRWHPQQHPRNSERVRSLKRVAVSCQDRAEAKTGMPAGGHMGAGHSGTAARPRHRRWGDSLRSRPLAPPG